MKILITGGNGNIATIIKNNLSKDHDIIALSRLELNILNFSQVKNYLENNIFDVLIHTAVSGGRRTKEDRNDCVYVNLLMFENLTKFADKFKLIINLDSAAIYDRNTDILNRSENELLTIPEDLYGLSKYVIYERSKSYNNIYNFRIFNIFHKNEENDRFIKACFIAKKNNTLITIYEDKYFDFFYEKDFITLLSFYISSIDSIDNKNILFKTINLSYKQKYKLSDIANLIHNNINIIKSESKNNYCGNNNLLSSYNLSLFELEKSIDDYSNNIII
jgi:nucleoside-diphosphate-sugar epimerase